MRLIATAMLVACLYLGAPNGVSAQDARPGIGPSTERPIGQTFEWPEGLATPERFKGYDANDCRRQPEEPTDETRGLQTYVRVCLAVLNRTQSTIRLDLPAGLIFVSVDEETQNGLLIKLETFEIPPGEEPYFVKLYMWCANADRSPSAYWDEYELGPVTEDQKILRVIRQLAGRELTQDDVGIVQGILWNATDGKELSDYHHTWLAGADQ